MKFCRVRGTVLVTALFVVICVHALVTVMLAALPVDSGALISSDKRIQASLKAHSAALYALDQLESSDGLEWEQNHTAENVSRSEPPPQAALIETPLPDGTQIEARAWVQETAEPGKRTVWGAYSDGKRWHFSTAVAIRREVNPGLLFGVRVSSTLDQIYFRPMDGEQSWQEAPPFTEPNTTVYDCVADRNGHLFVLQAEKGIDSEGKDLRVLMLDTQAGADGQWVNLPALPGIFQADPTGLAVGGDKLFLAGRIQGLPGIITLSEPSNPSPGATWQGLSRLPQATMVDEQGNKTNPPLPFQFTGLQADENGTLYMHLQLELATESEGAVSTFARYQNDSWSFFPKPSILTGSGIRGILPLAVDDLGNPVTFGFPKDGAAGKVFRFAADGGVQNEVVQGQWKEVPSPTGSGDDPGQKIMALSIDTQGQMVLGTKTEFDGKRVFDKVIEYPLRSAQSGVKELELPDSRMHFLEAGGEGPSGEIQYVPVSWY